ncbi:MAG: twin-arginine translocation signal domain-containing protein [Terracidiphilus sp.]
MESNDVSSIDRRDFLKLASAATACGLSQHALAAGSERFSLIVEPGNAAASSGPVKRALEQLRQTLAAKEVACEVASSAEAAAGSSFSIVVAAPKSNLAQGYPTRAALTAAESLRMSPGKAGRTPALLISATDVRGYVYGLLELADRVRHGSNPSESLRLAQVVEEKPANEVRSVSRYFCSELEDKSWYYDKGFWTGYLDAIVANRFNRFTMAYGLEYDFPRGVTDDYLHLPYPYLIDVPGYPDVRVMQLARPDGTRLATPAPLAKAEQDQNFEMLRFIAAQAGARGLNFQLGIWTHAYQWTDSPNAYHHIEGLTPQTHANYCRDALAIILKECPEIQGLTMRVHGESGIPEGSYPFWKTLFEAVSGAGREIEIDMHAKGVNQTMIDIATATGMPVKLGAKYSAEHQSLGYHQADIRALEIPHANLTKTEAALFSLSSGSRLFTRYGYGDFLHEGALYRLLFRSWPGTQRHLLSVDPEMAAAYSRSSGFCGAAGLDLMEPLTFKGREGSGVAGGRCAYADASLDPKADWQKYEYYYRVWGRKLYDPDADAEIWRRYLRSEFGGGALATETSLANASRILPLLTSAHLDSASNHDLWYEMPTNMPIVQGSEPSPYGDTPTPKIYGTVSPLDPQIFSNVVEYTGALLENQLSAKYSPVEVAQWIEDCTTASRESLDEARRRSRSRTSSEFRRIEEDVLIQIGLGTFFAHKLRSAVLFEIWQQTGDPKAGNLATAQYQTARDSWAAMAARAVRVYRSNVSYGDVPKRRGHWSDRLPGIDTDLAAMRAKVQETPNAPHAGQNVAEAVRAVASRPSRPSARCQHTPPDVFEPGQSLSLSLGIAPSALEPTPSAVSLYYRHVNQAERWTSIAMSGQNGRFSGAIPGEYTNSEYPLEYYFELKDQRGSAWLHPGFNKTLSNQPYFAVYKRSS